MMAKPQALPFLVPFAAYAIGRYGWRRAAVLGVIAGAVAAATWLPFLADGGPSRYLGNLGHYQDGVFAVLSLRAWNAWWLVQEPAAGGALPCRHRPHPRPVDAAPARVRRSPGWASWSSSSRSSAGRREMGCSSAWRRPSSSRSAS